VVDYLLYGFGVFLVYKATANVLSFPFLFWVFTAPVAFAADTDVKGVFAVGALCWGIGAIITNAVKGFRPVPSIKAYRTRSLGCGVSSAHALYVTLLVAFGIATFISLYYYSQVGISLFAGGDVGYERLVRRHATEGSYALQRVFRVTMPIICIAFFAMRFCDQTKRYYSNTKLAFAVFVTSALLIFTGMRGNLIIFIFTPFMVTLGLIEARLKLRNVIYLLGLTIGGGIVVTVLMYPDLPITDLLIVIIERISAGASDGIWYVVSTDYITNGPYLGMTYVNDLLSIFYKLGLVGSQSMTYGAQLAESMLGEAYNGEQAAVYFLGELFANFGPAGVYVGSAFVGCIAQLLYSATLRGRKTILTFSARIYFCALILPILGGPTVSMLLDYTIAVGSTYLALAIAVSTITAMRTRALRPLSYSLRSAHKT
jgi:hypothetical protein